MTSLPISFPSLVLWLTGFGLTAALASLRTGMFLIQWCSLADSIRDAHPPYTQMELRHASTTRGAHAPAALAVSLFALAVSAGTAWSKDKPTRFWNLTGETVMHLSIAVAGTGAYGPDQCRNDRDGTVDYDERLPITGIGPGRYDLLLDLKKGRRCRVKNVEIQQGEVFSVEEKDLGDCTP